MNEQLHSPQQFHATLFEDEPDDERGETKTRQVEVLKTNQLRVLITNIALSGRSGSETVVRDLAMSLTQKGHLPIIYSPCLSLPGQTGVAQEIRDAFIPVTDDLNSIAEPPHLIHGNHLHETVTACLHFPNTPAVWTCHSWAGPHDKPPKIPNILKYLAVDETCLERLLCEEGISRDKISLLLNCVDLERFRSRSALPATPRKALVISHYAANSQWFEMVKEACKISGLELDAVGNGLERVSDEPEQLLRDYDVVFAVDRSALEAAAMGCSVILCGEPGLGPMVTSDNCYSLYKQNFGRKWLSERCSVDGIVKRLSRYNPADMKEASELLRERAGSDLYSDKLISIYRETVDLYANEPHRREDDQQLLQSAAHYCSQLSTAVRTHIFGNAELLDAKLQREIVLETAERRRKRLVKLEQERHEAVQSEAAKHAELIHSQQALQDQKKITENVAAQLEESKGELAKLRSELNNVLESKTIVLKNKLLKLFGFRS